MQAVRYYSSEKVTMICRGTTNRPTAGSHSLSARVRNCTSRTYRIRLLYIYETTVCRYQSRKSCRMLTSRFNEMLQPAVCLLVVSLQIMVTFSNKLRYISNACHFL